MTVNWKTWKMQWIKKPWILISAAAFVICLIIIIIFSGGKSDESEDVTDQPVNIYLISGNIQTTSDTIDRYGFYTSTGKINVSVQKRGGFSGQLTLVDVDVQKTVKMDGVKNSYVFSGLDTRKAYSFTLEGLEDCTFTISEVVSGSDIHLHQTMPIDLNLGEFTVNAEDIHNYSFQTNSSKIYLYVNNQDSFEGEIRLWTVINGGDYVRSCDVDIVSDSCEFSNLRPSYLYQISCEELSGCRIVVSADKIVNSP